MNVEYKAGTFLLLSDCLSGLSNPATQEEDESLNLHVTSIESEESNLNLAEVCDALVNDPVSVLFGRFDLKWMARVNQRVGPRT